VSNADKVREVLEGLKSRQCKVAQCVAEQDDETTTLLNEIMWMAKNSKNRPTNYQLAQALRTLGYEISDATMDRHRRKTCVCFAYSGKNAS
jgi:hypothetical protein